MTREDAIDQELEEQIARYASDPWEPTATHRLSPGRYRVCLEHCARTEARSDVVEATLTARERDERTDRDNCWLTIHAEPIDPARGRYDHVEIHAHSGELRAYRIGGGLNE